MRISELSSHTEIPVATIKFYLRENLLHEGVRTAATQAQYDQSHVVCDSG
jgi:DNA-binding transcriptional MerR regulator